MKVAFLNPPDDRGAVFQKEIHRCGDRVHAGEVWPPTGLATLGAIARRSGWDAAVFDGMLGPESVSAFVARVAEARPDVLVVLTSTPTLDGDLDVARLARERTGAPVVAIGTHVTARPKDAFRRGADAVFVGEPDETLAECLGLGASTAHWRDVAGVALPDAPTPRERGLLHDLAWLPVAARDLLDNPRYTMPLSEGRPFATIQVARGCPYACAFCRTPAFSGREARQRPIASVLDEIRDVLARGVRDVAFLADTFTLDRRWVLELCDALPKVAPHLAFYATTRIDLMDDTLATALARAGCKALAFGIESASDITLTAQHKALAGTAGRASVRTIARRAIESAARAGIATLGYFVLGLPGETAADLLATARFARELPLDHAFFHVATPFPGTPLFDACVASGLLTSTDWRRFEETSMPVISTANLVPEQVWALRWFAQMSFYARPSLVRREVLASPNPRVLLTKIRAGIALLRPHT